MDYINKFLEVIKLPLEYAVGIAITISIVLFLPDDIVGRIGIIEYRNIGRPYLGVILLICLARIFAGLFHFIIESIKDIYSTYIFNKYGKTRLNNLTPDEKSLLANYVQNNKRSEYLDPRSGVVKGLEHENIIYRVSNISSPIHGTFAFAYNIQPWAWEYLNKNHELLHEEQPNK